MKTGGASHGLTSRVSDEDRELIALATLVGVHGVSQRTLARRTGWSQTRISRMLHGQRPTSVAERWLLKMAITEPDCLASLRRDTENTASRTAKDEVYTAPIPAMHTESVAIGTH